MQKNCGLAVASMVLGIVGIVFSFIPFISVIGVICAIIAIIMSVCAKNAIDQSNGELTGRGMATAGLVLGIITIGFFILALIACGALISASSQF